MTGATPRLALAVVAIAIAFALALTATATAKPLIGGDGKIHACYRVKGKPRGELRVVKSAKARCRRGERRVAWLASGAVGAPGASGTSGAAGHTGSPGAGGSSSITALEEKVLDLTTRVETLEGVLAGVTNKALTDAVASVSGLTNAQLLAAVGSVQLVETLCGEMTEVISKTNQLRDGVSTLASILGGTILGPIFGGIGLPTALPETLTCPAT